MALCSEEHDSTVISKPTTILDDSGALTLIVGTGTDQQAFRVNAEVLKLSSKVFRAMLGGRFAEATKDVVEIPDDSAEAFKIYLHIAHFKIAELPTSMTQLQLFTLATLCDKYDVVEIVRPYVCSKKWIYPHVRDDGLWKRGIDMVEWSTILSAFDQEEELEYLLNRMAMHIRLPSPKSTLTPDGTVYLNCDGMTMRIDDILADRMLGKWSRSLIYIRPWRQLIFDARRLLRVC